MTVRAPDSVPLMLPTLALLTGLPALFLAGTAQAASDGFFSRYNIGVTYEASVSYAQISYDSPRQPQLPPDCGNSSSGPQTMRCTAYLAPDSSSPSLSVFLEEPFKRQGFFYFEPGFTFATVEYKGTLAAKPDGPSVGRKTPGEAPEQPLTHALMEMYGVNWQGYLRLGITPHYLPDLLVTGGLGVQTVGGRIKLFTEDKTTYVVEPEAFFEVAAVLVRFGTGALSLFIGEDQSLAGTLGSKLIEDHPGGTALTNLQLSLINAESGIRLLFPF